MRVPDGIARQRLARIVVTGVVVTLASLVVAAARAADAPAQPAWNGRCVAPARSAPADCRMEQRLVAQETGQMLSLAVVEVPGDTREARLRVLLPTGLALSEAVTWQVDGGDARALPLAFCDGSGCIASVPLGKERIGSLQRGSQLIIKATTGQGQPLELTHSLADFTAIFGAIQ